MTGSFTYHYINIIVGPVYKIAVAYGLKSYILMQLISKFIKLFLWSEKRAGYLEIKKKTQLPS